MPVFGGRGELFVKLGGHLKPAPATQMKQIDAFSRGRLRPANRTRAKKQDGIINPSEEMYSRKHSTDKHEKRWMDSGDRGYCQLCHRAEVRLCCFSPCAQLVDTYENNILSYSEEMIHSGGWLRLWTHRLNLCGGKTL